MNNTLLEKLKQTFPDAVTETIKTVNGHKQIEYVLKQEFLDELTNNVDFNDDKERYELYFPGKKHAKWQARTPINKALKPKKEDSKDWDNTQDIYIEGDNIHEKLFLIDAHTEPKHLEAILKDHANQFEEVHYLHEALAINSYYTGIENLGLEAGKTVHSI